MNLDRNPTTDQLRELLRHCDDSAAHHVLWVKKNGEVELSSIPKDTTPAGFEEHHLEMQMRCEAFLAGNEYVGSEAADDDAWVSELFDSLVREWRVVAASRMKCEVVMNTEQVLMHGILKADGTLVLEETPRLPAGPVEVLIRPLLETDPAAETWWDYLQRSRAEMLAQGHTFRSKEEIDADRARARTASEERRQAVRRLQSPQE